MKSTYYNIREFRKDSGSYLKARFIRNTDKQSIAIRCLIFRFLEITQYCPHSKKFKLNEDRYKHIPLKDVFNVKRC